MKKLLVLVMLAFCAVLPAHSASAFSNAQSAADQNQQAQAPAANFDAELARISRADSKDALIKAADDAIAKFNSCEDYGRFVDALEKMFSERVGSKYGDVLYFLMARARMGHLSCLANKNDIESGRRYMSLNDAYRNDALSYIDKALSNAKSKDLILDSLFLKFLATKEEFQAQAADEFLNDMADRISKYSDDKGANKRQLERMADAFAANGLTDYALKLKIAYASKLDQKAGQEILEDIKKSGDKYFGQGNMKSASSTYDAYLKAGESYFNKEAMAGKLMEIAEKYFGAGRYRDALAYYNSYAANYPDSKVMDYCKYKTALCYYCEKDNAKAVAALEDFLSNYQNSVYFDKAFETLCKLYFTNFPTDQAVAGIQKLIDSYYRKNTGDYAYILQAILYYANKEYDKALEVLKKVDINSVYSYTAGMLTSDIKDIKNGGNPTFSFGLKDKYKIWEPGKPVTIKFVPMEAGDASQWLKGSPSGEDKKIEIKSDDAGHPYITVAPGAKVKFALNQLSDDDRFAEYIQDQSDLSRLPKKVRDEDEKDLISLQWSSGGGKFSDERQTQDKIWQAPEEPGSYKVSILVDDLGLVRSPDRGIRKDPSKEFTLIVNVQK